ncbi:response regulator transcription factor [Reichenbachiella versicolor]|uniref:response regulator transcription factor n=1 Tax=Reichenbachiella versicolor TaxID=1821036 RepID=UPI000D6DDAFE|nr:response regulator transcription factor [Reichenbachiella versicolor]
MKILLVDDHRIVRKALSTVLQEELKAEVIQASNGVEGINKFVPEEFDFMIADINMPQKNGIELTKEVRKLDKKIKIIALSMMDDSSSIIKMIKAGANGYVLKEGDTEELLEAINKIKNNEKFYSDGVTDKIMNSLVNNGKAENRSELTKRELQVLELVLKEKNNGEIAEELFISLRTVETHKHNIMEKTGAKNIAGLVKYALKEKLFDDLFY